MHASSLKPTLASHIRESDSNNAHIHTLYLRVARAG